MSEAQPTVGALGIHAVKKQHMKMNIEVQRTTKTLDEGDGPGLGRLAGETRLLDQLCVLICKPV